MRQMANVTDQESRASLGFLEITWSARIILPSLPVHSMNVNEKCGAGGPCMPSNPRGSEGATACCAPDLYVHPTLTSARSNNRIDWKNQRNHESNSIAVSHCSRKVLINYHGTEHWTCVAIWCCHLFLLKTLHCRTQLPSCRPALPCPALPSQGQRHIHELPVGECEPPLVGRSAIASSSGSGSSIGSRGARGGRSATLLGGRRSEDELKKATTGSLTHTLEVTAERS